MNCQAQGAVPGIDQSDWDDLGYTINTRAVPKPLNHALRPIFEQYHAGEKVWCVEDDIYRLLEPTLRLASALYRSPSSQRFIHDLIFAGKEDIPGSTPTLEFNISDTPYDTVQQKLRPIWEELAKYTRFYFDRPRTNEGRAETIPTSTPGKQNSPILKGDEVSGHSTKVYIHSKITDNLVKLLKEEPPNPTLILYAQLDLAVIICHELAHVVDYAMREKQFNGAPIYFGSERCAELGLAWQQYVIGGLFIPDIEDSDPEVARFLHHWPSFGPWENGKSCKARRGNPPELAVQWLLDFKHVDRLHQQSFWDELDNMDHDDPSGGYRNKVRFPKRVGQIVAVEEVSIYRDSNLEMVAGLGTDASGYTQDENNIVRKKAPKAEMAST